MLAHVRAARQLLPEWLERGRGHFLATVSAAGLLTMPGHAPYAVTKHGLWPSRNGYRSPTATAGSGVQALCPQGVRTPMLEAPASSGAAARAGRDRAEGVAERWSPAGLRAVPAAAAPEVARYSAGRAADPDAWLAAMRRIADSPSTPLPDNHLRSVALVPAQTSRDHGVAVGKGGEARGDQRGDDLADPVEAGADGRP